MTKRLDGAGGRASATATTLADAIRAVASAVRCLGLTVETNSFALNEFLAVLSRFRRWMGNDVRIEAVQLKRWKLGYVLMGYRIADSAAETRRALAVWQAAPCPSGVALAVADAQMAAAAVLHLGSDSEHALGLMAQVRPVQAVALELGDPTVTSREVELLADAWVTGPNLQTLLPLVGIGLGGL
ncbi:hypothetical protein MMPV_008378 [Pyropia vietnamensis]